MPSEETLYDENGEIPEHRDEDVLREFIVDEGKSFKQTARELGVTNSCIRSWASFHGIQKPLQDKELLREKIEEGWWIEDMMDYWDEPQHKVYVALSRHGLLNDGRE